MLSFVVQQNKDFPWHIVPKPGSVTRVNKNKNGQEGIIILEEILPNTIETFHGR